MFLIGFKTFLGSLLDFLITRLKSCANFSMVYVAFLQDWMLFIKGNKCILNTGIYLWKLKQSCGYKNMQ